MKMIYAIVYLAGVLWAIHRYSRRLDTRTTETVWRLGLMASFWFIPALGEVARWWGRRLS